MTQSRLRNPTSNIVYIKEGEIMREARRDWKERREEEKERWRRRLAAVAIMESPLKDVSERSRSLPFLKYENHIKCFCVSRGNRETTSPFYF